MRILKVTDISDTYIAIKVDFEKNGQKAHFIYDFFNHDSGIQECSYEEEKGEDIYADIHDWVEEHIENRYTILYDGKEI